MIHLVTLDFPPGFDGGVASWAHDTARALAAAGRAVTVYARSTGDTREHDRALGFPVLRLGGRSWARRGALWVDLQVSPLVRRGDAVIFATWPIASRACPRLARRGIAAAVVFHGSDLSRLERCPPGLSAVLESARACLPVSAFLRGELARLAPGADPGRWRVLPQPAPLGGGSAGPRGLVVCARLNALKGVDRVLAIGAALGWPVTVVGDGPERGALEALAARLGVAARFTGRLPRARALRAYDGHAACLLLPRRDRDGSGAEGFGMVLLEAMGRGVPAVGCATGGVPEALGPGLLLPRPDSAEDSAGRIRAWLAGGDRGAEARAWVAAHHGGARTAAALLRSLGRA